MLLLTTRSTRLCRKSLVSPQECEALTEEIIFVIFSPEKTLEERCRHSLCSVQGEMLKTKRAW